MILDPTDRELDLTVRALEELVKRRKTEKGLSTVHVDALIQKLLGQSTPDTVPAADLGKVPRPSGQFKRPRKKE